MPMNAKSDARLRVARPGPRVVHGRPVRVRQYAAGPVSGTWPDSPGRSAGSGRPMSPRISCSSSWYGRLRVQDDDLVAARAEQLHRLGGGEERATEHDHIGPA